MFVGWGGDFMRMIEGFYIYTKKRGLLLCWIEALFFLFCQCAGVNFDDIGLTGFIAFFVKL